MYMHTLARFCESRRRFFSPLSLKYYILFFLSRPLLPVVCSVAAVCAPWLPCRLPSPLLPLSPSGAPLKLPGGLLCVLSCFVLPAVTRQLSGARQCGSVGRCTAYMSPAVSVSPLAYVLPAVPSLFPWLVLLPAACCRLVVTIACTPQYPERRRCGAASAM